VRDGKKKTKKILTEYWLGKAGVRQGRHPATKLLGKGPSNFRHIKEKEKGKEHKKTEYFKKERQKEE